MAEDERELSERAMADIRDLEPDLVVALGDFGTHARIGSPEGLEEAYALLRTTGAPVRAILGNHDLQRESGPGLQPKGLMEREARRAFSMGPEEVWGVIEREHLRLVFVTTEAQPADDCHQVQECYASDRQFAALTAQLERRRGVPTIVFSHAPPIGCGLRTVPGVHVRATNAYLDQNHDPYRWQRWMKEFPEIVLWFSAHYHLSHHYEDAHTVRHGVHFFTTGVHGNGSRDGFRQSRVIDVDERGGVSVRTLDHGLGALMDVGAWASGVPLHGLMQEKLFRRVASCRVGTGSARRNGLLALPGERFVVPSEDGYAWEALPELEAVLGTLHVKAPVSALAFSGALIWSAWGRELGASPADRPERFARVAAGGAPVVRAELDAEAVCLAAAPDGAAWVADGSALLLARAVRGGPDAGEESGANRVASGWDANGVVRTVKLCALPGRVHQLVPNGEGCLIVASGELWSWGGSALARIELPGAAIAADAHDGSIDVLLDAGGELRLVRRRRGEERGWSVPPMPGFSDVARNERPDLRFFSLGDGGRFVFSYGDRLMYWQTDWPRPLALSAGAAGIAAAAPALDASGRRSRTRFASAAAGTDDVCRLELWELLPNDRP